MRTRFFLGTLLLLGACSMQEREPTVCDELAEHVASCLGGEAEDVEFECNEADAERLLEQDCDQLVASLDAGKADIIDFLCRVFGIFCRERAPCEELECGDECEPEGTGIAVVHTCSPDGECLPRVFECADPCEGLQCGDECFPAGPAPDIIFVCDNAGECTSQFPECPPPPSCNGIRGTLCPEGLTCIDDPSDTCDPTRGGADCLGICVPPE